MLTDEEKLERKRAKWRESKRKQYVANREKIDARNRAWKVANPDRVKAASKRRYNQNPEKARGYAMRWRLANPDKHREYRRKQYAINPERYREDRRRYKYGLAAGQWDELFATQQYRCAICKTDAPGPKPWQTDHCHADGRVRGILCNSCNVALGYMKDSPTLLRAAAGYLEAMSKPLH